MQIYDDSALMEKEVLKYIPVETPITLAKEVMEKNVFRCVQDGDYLCYELYRGYSFSLFGHQFIFGDKKSLLVIISYENSFVTQIKVMMTPVHEKS